LKGICASSWTITKNKWRSFGLQKDVKASVVQWVQQESKGVCGGGPFACVPNLPYELF